MNAQSNGAPASLPDFVPVIVIGAGPTGMTAATLLYSVGCNTLWEHDTTRDTTPDQPLGSSPA